MHLTFSSPYSLLFALLIAHAVADYPLQGEYLAKAKIPSKQNGYADWVIPLTAHSLIHAGAVWLLTQCIWLGIIELILHWVIDLIKGINRITLMQDQLLHVCCKILYVFSWSFFVNC